jgi:hypothetical protein
MFKRRRFKQTVSLVDRLKNFAKAMREKAEVLPPGPDRKAAPAKATEAATTGEMDRWVSAPELKPPAD